ncbi:MAG: flagellar hook-basal body complex protein FliE [Burkholderiaceae bacterium]|nr:flagellar hook-basal body complex protein FliE [Burkholderiaceae bacterium]
MDLSIKSVNPALSVVGASQAQAVKSSAVSGGGFQDALLKALQQTSALQKESGRLSREFSLDNPTVSLEETMVAGAKSSIAFQATLQVRNRFVQAYSEIMNMQI